MSANVKPVPEDQPTLTPYLCVNGADEAIAFYEKAFGARETMRMSMPNGSIGHAEIAIGDAKFMLSDEYPDMQFRGPRSFGGSPIHLHLYVDDSDAVVDRAVTAGARLLRPVKDQFYGDRTGSVEDPFGHVWHVATHKEDLTMEELERRFKAECGAPG